MLLLGLLVAGVAVGALSGASDSDGATAEDINLFEGDENDDTLIGSNQTDLLFGLGGADDMTGKDGDDLLLGDEGNDLLKGRSGQDYIDSGAGDDDIRCGQDSDYLLGAAGNDTVYGGGGDDVLVGSDIFNRDQTVGDILNEEGDPDLPPLTYQPQAGPEANYLYDEEDDTLVIRYTESEPTPTITLDLIGDVRHVHADGQLVARVQGDGGPFFASDLRLAAI